MLAVLAQHPVLNPVGLALVASSLLFAALVLTLPALASLAGRAPVLLAIGGIAYAGTVAIAAWPRPETRALQRATRLRRAMAELLETSRPSQPGHPRAGLGPLVADTLEAVDRELLPSLRDLGDRTSAFALTIRRCRRDELIKPAVLQALQAAHTAQERAMEAAVDALSESYAHLLLLAADTGESSEADVVARAELLRQKLGQTRQNLQRVLDDADDWDRRLAERVARMP